MWRAWHAYGCAAIILVLAVAAAGCPGEVAIPEEERAQLMEPEPIEPGEFPLDAPDAPPRLPGPDEWFFGPPDPEVPLPWAGGCDTPWPMPGCPVARMDERIPGDEGMFN